MTKPFCNRKYCLLLFGMLLFVSCEREQEKEVLIAKGEVVTVDSTQNTPAVPDLAVEINRIVQAFQRKDTVILNAYINPEIGFYLIPGPGTIPHFEAMEAIDFSNGYLSYHQFGVAGSSPNILKKEMLPQYSCETFTWSEYGLYAGTGKSGRLTGIMEMQSLAGEEGHKGSAEDKAIAKRVDAVTTDVVLAEKDTDIVFGIALIAGRYYLTYLDLRDSYCDV